MLSARAAHTWQSFHFQKITGTLKIKTVFWKFGETFFYIKEQLKKNKIQNLKFFVIFFLKNGETGFWPKQKYKKNLGSFSSFLAFE